MGLKFAGEPEPGRNEGNGNSALDELRNLLSKPTKGGHQEAMPPEDVDAIVGRLEGLPDDEVAQMVSTHKRLDELVDSWHKVRENPDNRENLMNFVKLIKTTAENFPAVSLGSIMSAGIAAIVELERRDKDNKNGKRD